MRVAVIGCGSIGARHARNLKALGIEHVLLADRDFSKAAALAQEIGAMAEGITYGARTGCSYADGANAVIVATPASTHAAVALELMENGYAGPLFVEKPIVGYRADQPDVLDDGRVFRDWPHLTMQIGYNWRFHDGAVTALADPSRFLHFECFADMAAWPGAGYSDPLLENSHEIDLVLARYGVPASFTCGMLYHGGGAWIQTPEALVDVLWRIPRDARPVRRLTVQASRGISDYRRHSFTTGDATKEPAALTASYRAELAEFLACAAAGTAPATGCTAAQGLAVAQFVDGVNRRLRGGARACDRG